MLARTTPRMVDGPISVMRHEHDQHGEALAAVEAITQDITPPADACNTWRALYTGLAQLREDLMEHIHLENNILSRSAEPKPPDPFLSPDCTHFTPALRAFFSSVPHAVHVSRSPIRLDLDQQECRRRCASRKAPGDDEIAATPGSMCLPHSTPPTMQGCRWQNVLPMTSKGD